MRVHSWDMKLSGVLKLKPKIIKNLAENLIFLGIAFLFLGSVSVVWAASTSTFSQTITVGTLSVDIVDANGSSVGSPSVSFPSYSFSYDVGTSTATFGAASQKVRVSNPTLTDTWSLTIAPTTTQGVWYTAASTYGYKSHDHTTGTMQVDPSIGTLSGVSGCSTSNVSKGSESYFSPTLESVTLLTASAGAATSCRWDFTGVEINQEIPAGQAAGSYQIGMTVTVS